MLNGKNMHANGSAPAAGLSTGLARLRGLLPTREEDRRKALAVVAGVLAVVLALRFLAGWYTGYQLELDEAIEMKTLQMEQLKRLAAGSSDYVELNKQLGQFQGQLSQGRFIEGGSPSLSEALFQNVVKDLAQKGQINLRAIKSLPPHKKEGLAFLNMSINARAEIGAIKNFLLLVQNSGRYIFFTEVEIKQLDQKERRYYYFNAKLSALTTS